MHKCTLLIVVALLLMAGAMLKRSQACSLIRPEPFQLDQSQVGVDTTPPAPPTVQEIRITRGQAGGCGSSTSCDDLGAVIITLTGSDDRTPLAELGYVIELVSGEPPSGMQIPGGPVKFGTDIVLSWSDGEQKKQEDFAFTLRVRAVDLGGNRSEPTEVSIDDGGRSGCNVSGASSSGSLPLFLFVSLWILMRGRRSAV